MTTLDFDAQVTGWVRETRERMTAVFRESVQRTISQAQQNVPVDTGYLRSSLQVSLRAMPRIIAGSAGNPAASYTWNNSAIILTILGANLGDTIFAGYTAGYAAAVEYGTATMAPRAYVGRAAAQWRVIVNQVSAEAERRAARRP